MTSYTLPRRSNQGSHGVPPPGFTVMVSRMSKHGAAATLVGAAGQLASAYSSIWDSHERISKDKTSNPTVNLMKSAKLARQKLEGAFRGFRDAEVATVNARADLKRKVDAPFDMNNRGDGQPWSYPDV